MIHTILGFSQRIPSPVSKKSINIINHAPEKSKQFRFRFSGAWFFPSICPVGPWREISPSRSYPGKNRYKPTTQQNLLERCLFIEISNQNLAFLCFFFPSKKLILKNVKSKAGEVDPPGSLTASKTPWKTNREFGSSSFPIIFARGELLNFGGWFFTWYCSLEVSKGSGGLATIGSVDTTSKVVLTTHLFLENSSQTIWMIFKKTSKTSWVTKKTKKNSIKL